MADGASAQTLTEAEFHAMQMIVAWLTRQAEDSAFDAGEIDLKLNPASGYMLFGIDRDGTVIKNSDVVRASMILIWSLVMELAETTSQEVEEIIGSIGLNVARHNPNL